ncbi:MAG: hypothetical protein Q4C60_08105 [Eubacteriales bacterium]|nr:hypothetical protein [Eubacteriales bacterium]
MHGRSLLRFVTHRAKPAPEPERSGGEGDTARHGRERGAKAPRGAEGEEAKPAPEPERSGGEGGTASHGRERGAKTPRGAESEKAKPAPEPERSGGNYYYA